jgi:phage terminase large subunit-like protein
VTLASAATRIELDLRFPTQNAFVLDLSHVIAAQCSRRAGKSNGLALRFFRTMERHPGCRCVYVALTFDSAHDIMWPVLEEMNDRYKLGLRLTESKLVVIHPNGAQLRLYGADMKNFIKRLKGRKFAGVGIDEAQDFGSHLQSLIDDVLEPATADYADGWLALTGTPGPVPAGYFFDVTHGKKYGYSLHNWTMFDNPFMPDPQKFVDGVKRRHEWPDNHPTLLREYYNQWVLDTKSLWVQYNKEQDDFDSLPELGLLPDGRVTKWHYILGIDLGFRDADALAVLAWSEMAAVTYLVEEVVTAKQGLTELVNQVNTISKKYDFDKMVIDEGGLGKKIAEEMRRQHQIPVQAADKLRKQENVEFLNDAMRLGRFKAKSTSRFVQDSYLVQVDWEKSTSDKIVLKKSHHSDIIDAALYAFKESPAFTFRPQPKKPARGTKEWAEAQEDGMFEAELEGLTKEAEMARDPYEIDQN